MLNYNNLPDYLQKGRKQIEGSVLGVLFQDIMSVKEYKLDDMFITNVRYFFEHGAFRFKDLKCKEALLKCISY